MAFPALNHVALTVRDLGVSGPWYQTLIGADPVLDEHTDAGFRHLVWAFENGTLFGIHQHDRDLEGGMAVTVGRVRTDKLFDLKLEVLVHNTIRGAAGAAILNAELLKARDLLP